MGETRTEVDYNQLASFKEGKDRSGAQGDAECFGREADGAGQVGTDEDCVLLGAMSREC